MNRKTTSEVISAYNRRNKGRNDGTFVDRTRHGAYLEINKRGGLVREISEAEYHASSHPKYDDGTANDSSERCSSCGRYYPCRCDYYY